MIALPSSHRGVWKYHAFQILDFEGEQACSLCSFKALSSFHVDVGILLFQIPIELVDICRLKKMQEFYQRLRSWCISTIEVYINVSPETWGSSASHRFWTSSIQLVSMTQNIRPPRAQSYPGDIPEGSMENGVKFQNPYKAIISLEYVITSKGSSWNSTDMSLTDSRTSGWIFSHSVPPLLCRTLSHLYTPRNSPENRL